MIILFYSVPGTELMLVVVIMPDQEELNHRVIEDQVGKGPQGSPGRNFLDKSTV